MVSDNMKIIKVRRANVLLRVPEEQKGEYLAKGFDILDDNGNVVEYTTPSDVGTLKTAYVNHIKEIDKLKSEIKKLKSDLRATKKKSKEINE